MKKQEKIIEVMTRRIVQKIVDTEVYGWPPQCATIYYQPIRPQKGAIRQDNEKRG